MGMHSPLLIGVSFGQVPGQVFTKKGLKEVKYEKYKSIPSACTAKNPDNQGFLIFY
jgi:hypothetical protein